MNMERTAIITRLEQDFKYPPQGAELVATRLAGLQGPLRDAFVRWWESGTLPDLTIGGYTVERLMREQRMNPIASFLTLDWLEREPEKAIASLKKGHDQIS